MRRIFFGTGILVLGLGMLTWAMAPVIAARGGGGGGGGGHAPAGGGHAGAAVGSVHYGGRPAPAHVGPAAPAGAVRSEHYAGSVPRGGYRNPYRDDYFRRFRPGYLSFVFGDALYYYYDSLPIGFQVVVLDGITYYVFNGVYYQAYIYGGQTVYLVVPAPG